MPLSLRPTVIAGDKIENDFGVIHEGRTVGRIRLATERTGNPGWTFSITVPLPIPPYGNGSKPTLDEAKAAFREAWVRFYAGLDAKSIEIWHNTQDAGKRKRARQP